MSPPPSQRTLVLATLARLVFIPPSPDRGDCYATLRRANVSFLPQASVVTHPPEAPDLTCLVTDPVTLHSPLHGVTFRYDKAHDRTSLWITCRLAVALERWTEALSREGVVEVVHKGSYQCRPIAGSRDVSAHGSANAIDVAAFQFVNGERFSVEHDWKRREAAAWFSRVVESASETGVFNVILTPDFDEDHHDHIHFDLTPGQRFLSRPRRLWPWVTAALVMLLTGWLIYRRRRTRHSIPTAALLLGLLSFSGCSRSAPTSDVCPPQFLRVRENAKFGTNKPFCVAKYEMKRSPSDVATSTAATLPWTNVSQLEASKACRRIDVRCHLIRNAEWMTVAVEVADNAQNWSGGRVGVGALNVGNSDNPPWLTKEYALAASDDRDPCFGTANPHCESGEHADFRQKRTHRLASGEAIWDLAGNVWEWVDWNVAPQERIAIGPKDDVWYELLTLTPNDAMPARSIRPDAPWSSQQGVGKYYPGHPGFGGAAVRGGYWGRPENSGVFALHLSRTANAAMKHAGFRCACDR